MRKTYFRINNLYRSLKHKNNKVALLFILVQFVYPYFINTAHAQQLFTLSGYVKDASTNETLISANIFIKELNTGIVTDVNGWFSVSSKPGKYTIKVSYIGYETIEKTISINRNESLNFLLKKESVEVDAINISAEKEDANIKTEKAGTFSLQTKDIEKLPTLMGEVDVLNAIKLSPGIQAGGEGNPGLYVRGGDAGQNLILLDGMTLHNPSHLLGFFPVFNASIIDNVEVFKGGIPAQYGGRASSVIDISMKEGNSNNFTGSGNIGLLSSSITLESPFSKNKGAFVISARRTYLEGVKVLSKPFLKSSDSFFNNTNYYFYDGSIKAKYHIGKKTKLFVTGFGGQDNYTLTDREYDVTNTMTWVNTAVGFRLNHMFNNSFFMNISSSKSFYNFKINANFGKYGFNLSSNIDDWNNKVDFTWLGENSIKIKFGGNYIKHVLTPNNIDVDAGEIRFRNINRFYSNEYSAYTNLNIPLGTNTTLSGGLRGTYYEHIGPYTHYIKNELEQVTDSTVFANGEVIQNYLTLDPNLNFVYVLNNKSSVKGSASMAHQFMHLASVGTVSLPTDVWLPSTSFIKPQQVWQVSSGYFRNFFNNTFESSVEVYYKHMNNQVDFLNGVLDNFDNTKIESNILQGTGKAFGAEFFLKKQKGNTTGWISYTISKTLRRFNEINHGYYFPAKYDRVHDISVTLSRKLNKKWNVSAVFVYSTGNAMTLPAGRYIIQGSVANHYTDVNSFRMPAYHRLDISASYELKKKERFESTLNFSVYNVYSRSNPYFIYFAIEGDLEKYKLSVSPKQISLFPILPSVTWQFKF